MGAKESLVKQRHFGLIGQHLAHSFSKDYFAKKFESFGLQQCSYNNFEFENVHELAAFLLDDVYKLDGFNVTIPYKESIIPYLDSLHETAASVQAVNTVMIKDDRLIGYNTDIYGFLQAFSKAIKPTHKKALLLGTGGASKSVAFAMKSLGIEVTYVSRNPIKSKVIAYADISSEMMLSHQIIINCTPVGTFPNTTDYPNIPYQYISKSHLVLDLIYNPKQTVFLKKAKEQGAQTKNGLAMLQFQAEKSWEIWLQLA